MGIAAGNAIGQAVIASLVILLENGIEVSAVGVDSLVQHPRQIAELPVWPDKAHRRPGDRAANQRIENTR
jgi:hypothetical protein